MLVKSVETVLKLSDFYTITAVRWQYTPHIHALYISSNMFRSTYLGRGAKTPFVSSGRCFSTLCTPWPAKEGLHAGAQIRETCLTHEGRPKQRLDMRGGLLYHAVSARVPWGRLPSQLSGLVDRVGLLPAVRGPAAVGALL